MYPSNLSFLATRSTRLWTKISSFYLIYIYQYIYPSNLIYKSIFFSNRLWTKISSFHLSIYLSIHLSIYISIYFSNKVNKTMDNDELKEVYALFKQENFNSP